MSIAYNKTTWINNTAPAISAANLQNIEDTVEKICTGGVSSGLECQFLVATDGTKLQPTGSPTKLWTDANDGSASGLDADLLDGLHAISFAYAYQAGRTYALNDICTYGGIIYKSLQSNNTGNLPSTATVWWAFAVPALSGDVVNVVTGTASASTIQANVVSNSKLAQMAKYTIKGNNTSGTANAVDMTVDEFKTLLGTSSSATEVNNLTSEWATNIIGGAAGSLPYQTSSGATAMLTLGANGYVLTSNGSAPAWTAASLIPVGVASNIANGAAGQLVYQTGAGATNFVAVGTSGQVLKSNGSSAPSWTSTISVTSVTASSHLIIPTSDPGSYTNGDIWIA